MKIKYSSLNNQIIFIDILGHKAMETQKSVWKKLWTITNKVS